MLTAYIQCTEHNLYNDIVHNDEDLHADIILHTSTNTELTGTMHCSRLSILIAVYTINQQCRCLTMVDDLLCMCPP